MDDQVMRSSMDRAPSGSKSIPRQSSTDDSNQSQNSNGSLSKARSSIMKKRIPTSDSSEPARSRNDSLGNEIKPGSKKHKIQFRAQLCEIKEVESFKQFNSDEEINTAKNCCNIF